MEFDKGGGVFAVAAFALGGELIQSEVRHARRGATMMRGLIRVGWVLLPLVGLVLAQDLPKPWAVSDVSLSVVGDASGLGPYIATIGRGIKQAWIDGWPSDAPEPGRYVLTLRINHAGYLATMDGSEFVPTTPPHTDLLARTGDRDPARVRRITQIMAATRATEKVFTGLPPAPPDDYSHSIVVKVVFVFGVDRPQL
jgi:hypothetical protein